MGTSTNRLDPGLEDENMSITKQSKCHKADMKGYELDDQY